MRTQFSKQILLILLEYLIAWLGVYANDSGNTVRQQHQTLKAVTDGKLLTFKRSWSTSELA